MIDLCNTLRIGSEMAGVKGKVTYSTSGYHFTLTEKPSVSYNARSVAPTVNDYNLKVMSFNAENFICMVIREMQKPCVSMLKS